MKKKLLILSTAIALASPLASAVVLNPRGTGQVLLYPYYTVNGGNTTLLTIGNMSNRGKAVKVRFAEGRNGRSVIDFNLYLSPHDVWTGAVFSLDEKGAANLITEDNSCTIPFIKNNPQLPKLPDERHYLTFSNFTYTAANEDAGPSELSRTREGMIEVIEMGTVGGDTLDAITLVGAGDSRAPRNCDQVVNAWIGGYWKADPNKDLTNPTGGLYGNVQIIDVAAGTMLSYNAEALEEFRRDPTDSPRGTKNSVVLNTEPGSLHPNLSDALTDPVKKLASASVMVEDRLIRADYPADTQAIDAVSAVLMADNLNNDYVVDLEIGAQSEWIVTFPTKRFYTDQAVVGNTPIAPFTTLYPNSGDENTSCMKVGLTVSSREAESTICLIGHFPPCSHDNMCYMTNVVPFSSSATSTNASTLVTSGVNVVALGISSGLLDLDFGDNDVPVELGPQRQLRAALPPEMYSFMGLPAIGFLATNYVNNHVLEGVLANYSGTFPHRTIAKCTNNGADC